HRRVAEEAAALENVLRRNGVHRLRVFQSHAKGPVFFQQGYVATRILPGQYADVVDIDVGVSRLPGPPPPHAVVANRRELRDFGPEPGQIVGDVTGCAPSRRADMGGIRGARLQSRKRLAFDVQQYGANHQDVIAHLHLRMQSIETIRLRAGTALV